MNPSLSFCRKLLVCSLIMTASATTARSQFYDPYGVQDKYHPFGENGPTFQYTNPIKVLNVLNGGSNFQPSGRAAQRVPPPRTMRLDDLNLAVTMPGGQWAKVDSHTGSSPRFMLQSKHPAIVLSLAGEQVGSKALDPDTTLLAESQANITKLGGTVESGEQQLSAGHIDGLAYSATVDDGEFTTYYAMWVAAHNGYKYQLAVYGDKHDKAMIDAVMHNFVHGIQAVHTTAVARHNIQSTTFTR
jgi:hypothetical protein